MMGEVLVGWACGVLEPGVSLYYMVSIHLGALLYIWDEIMTYAVRIL